MTERYRLLPGDQEIVYFDVFINRPNSLHPRLHMKPTDLKVVIDVGLEKMQLLFHEVPDQKIMR